MAASMQLARSLPSRPITLPPCTTLLQASFPACRAWIPSCTSRRPCIHICMAAAVEAEPAQAVEDTQPSSQPQEQPFWGLPLPDTRHQPTLDFKTIKKLRTQRNAAASSQQLITMQIGDRGVTQTFLSACMDVLQKHQILKVKLGPGCGLERESTAKAFEQLLDCVCIFQIGYTISLYRQAGLPRPSNCPSNHPTADSLQDDDTAQQEEPAAAHAEQDRGNKSKKGKKPAKGKPRAPRVKDTSGPAEFEVLK